MAQVLLSLGSNVNRRANIDGGLASLRRLFGSIICSRIYESEAVGFDGDAFYNLVVAVETDFSVAELLMLLHQIEYDFGRVRGGKKFSSRTLDIDILSYDEQVGLVDGIELPRGEILQHAFVLLPMAELVPEQKHPVLKQSYADLWQAFDKKAEQKLWPID